MQSYCNTSRFKLTAGAQAPHPQNHARRVPQPCSHGNGRAAGVSVTPGLKLLQHDGKLLQALQD